MYGTPRDHVLGLTLVSADGSVLRWGGRVVKNVAGFDLTRLTVGSWGCLGVVTSVSARLFPVPEADTTLLIRSPNVLDLLPVARAMALSPLPLAAVELLDPLEATEPISAAVDGAVVSPGLALRLMGSQAQVAEMKARIGSEITQQGMSLNRLEGDRSRAFHETLNGWEDGGALVVRLSLLPSGLETLLEEVGELKSLMAHDPAMSARLRVSAHVGAGIVRVVVEELPKGGGTLSAWASALRQLRSRLELAGGSLTISSGPGDLIKTVGAWGEIGEEREIMRGLKRQFDPEGILAPGRLGL